ncbi:MAG: hypothetical protein ACI9PY_001272 [Ascidiaceihabitans sp.]|jgi:hypothetical protein
MRIGPFAVLKANSPSMGVATIPALKSVPVEVVGIVKMTGAANRYPATEQAWFLSGSWYHLITYRLFGRE